MYWLSFSAVYLKQLKVAILDIRYRVGFQIKSTKIQAIEFGEEVVYRSMKSFVDMICTIIKFRPSSICLLYTSPSPRDQRGSRMPSSA